MCVRDKGTYKVNNYKEFTPREAMEVEVQLNK